MEKPARTLKRPPAPVLPGDPSVKDRMARVIRVNHAGEYGARRIYEGQIAILGPKAAGGLLQEMLDQEIHHLKTFETEMRTRHVRPTALHPLWHVLGFALGAGTALLGEKAAMACTVAVEEVIEDHYEQQLQTLPGGEESLGKTIRQFQADEVHHRDIGLDCGAEQAPAYQILTGVIRRGTKAAIWLSERI
jgi:3-demethoxyubiquinol 3-hydroxylase